MKEFKIESGHSIFYYFLMFVSKPSLVGALPQPCKCYEDGHNDIDNEDYNDYNNDDDNDNCVWMAREMVMGMIDILKIMIPCLLRRLKKKTCIDCCEDEVNLTMTKPS